METTHACKESNWLKRICSNMRIKQGTMTIYCDSQSVIYLAKNPTFHAQTKHNDVQYIFVRDMVEDCRVKVVKVDTFMNVVDSITKVVSIENFKWCSESMGLMDPSN